MLYYLTGARSEPEGNIAGKYACIVDFMHEQGVEDHEAAEYIQKADGIDELLKNGAEGSSAQGR